MRLPHLIGNISRGSYLVPGTVGNTAVCIKSPSLPNNPMRVHVNSISISEILEIVGQRHQLICRRPHSREVAERVFKPSLLTTVLCHWQHSDSPKVGHLTESDRNPSPNEDQSLPTQLGCLEQGWREALGHLGSPLPSS